MTSKGNILSFDDAKKQADRSRLSSGNSRTSTQNPTASKHVSRTPAPKASARLRSEESKRPSVRSRTYFIADAKSVSGPEGRGPDGSASTRRSVQSDSRSKKPKTNRTPDSTKSDGRANPGSLSRRSQVRSKSSKRKAERSYSKQFGNASQPAEDSSSRAAVYKGEMGRSHKKASKMQGSSSRGKSPKAAFQALPSAKRSPRTLTGFALAAGLALSLVFLYPVAQQYYLALRDYEQVQAEYLVVEQRNDEIRAEIEKLSDPEGIEDKLREEYGWVKEGEQSIRVQGLDIKEPEVNYAKSIPSGSVKAEGSWYTPVLDKLFGYSHEEGGSEA